MARRGPTIRGRVDADRRWVEGELVIYGWGWVCDDCDVDGWGYSSEGVARSTWDLHKLARHGVRHGEHRGQ